MVERRKAERAKSFLKAKIHYNNRMASFDCVIRNISTLGAKLAIDPGATVPNEFELEIPMKGKTYHAKMRWRDSEGIGVEFAEEAAVKETGTSAARLDQLQAENARLKAAVVSLSKRLEDLGQDVPKFF